MCEGNKSGHSVYLIPAQESKGSPGAWPMRKGGTPLLLPPPPPPLCRNAARRPTSQQGTPAQPPAQHPGGPQGSSQGTRDLTFIAMGGVFLRRPRENTAHGERIGIQGSILVPSLASILA